jgi:hypothetical protein
MPSGANGHNDFALTADGKDVLVYQNTQNDYICMTDFDTLTETTILKIPFTVNPDIGLHFSGNCAEKSGWALVSTYGAKQPPEGASHSWMDTQLFMLQLRQNPMVWRIAHTHCYTSYESTREKNYYAEAFATVNNAGTRVYFGSNWGDFTADYTDTYQVMLPSDWNKISSAVTPLPASSSPQPTAEQGNGVLPLNFLILAAVVVIIVVPATVLLAKRMRDKKKATLSQQPQISVA